MLWTKVSTPSERYCVGYVGQDPLELGKQFNEAGHRGDIEAALSLVAEDVVVTDLGAPLDAAGGHRGRDGLLSYYARFAQEFDDLDREVEEWVAQGDWVIAVGGGSAPGRKVGHESRREPQVKVTSGTTKVRSGGGRLYETRAHPTWGVAN